MKQPLLNIILLSSIFLIFSQCKKENVDPEQIEENVGIKRGEIKLSNAELNIVPYLINDTVIFKDSLGNTLIFQVESRQTHLGRVYKNGGTDSSTDYYDIEALTVSLSDNNMNNIMLRLSAPLPYYCSNQNINKNHFVVSTHMDGSASFNGYIDTTDFYFTIQGVSIPFHNTLTLINNTYNSVYEFNYSQNGSSITYYNKTEGIVGFKMEDGTIWYLDN
tara:strand:- start:426 stop:1082 length:657 start_codon:yes stop_codon:yes gene_type:complete